MLMQWWITNVLPTLVIYLLIYMGEGLLGSFCTAM